MNFEAGSGSIDQDTWVKWPSYFEQWFNLNMSWSVLDIHTFLDQKYANS